MKDYAFLREFSFLPLVLLLSYEVQAETVSVNSNATTLVAGITGSGVTTSSEALTVTGASQSGTFTGFNFLTDDLMDEGVVLGTGDVADLVNGPPTTNTVGDITTSHNGSSTNDGDLGSNIFDPAKLTFNVTPQYDTLIIDFLFGSDEYNEYVGDINDQMSILVNGIQCAETPDGNPFSINTVNNGNNASLYNDNESGTFASEMDGFTRVLSCRISVTPGVSVPMVIGLYDDFDASYDSWLMLGANSLRSEPSNDYGDAPDGYATLLSSDGPRHTVVEGVYIGTKPTGDPDGFVDGTDDSAGAATDDSNDDGVISFPALTDATTSYSLSVSATSINGNSSTLIGWIDFDGDGVFQTDEASNAATVSSGAFESSTTLTWSNIGSSGPDIALGDTYLRLRISNTALTASDTDGAYASGEVEDYAISVVDGVSPVVSISSAPAATLANAATYPVSGICTAGDGNVTVSIAGATPGSQAVACSGGGTWSATFDVSAIGDGSDVIDVDASQTDGAGNTGNATLVEADKDTIAPVVVTTGASNVTAISQASYSVSGTCTAGDGDVTVAITGATPASQAATCSGGGTWGATFDVSAIGDGLNVVDISASQTDSAGNTGSATLVEVSKDVVVPAIATTSAPAANVANQSSYPVSGTCTPGDGDVTVTITGATPGSQTAACGGGGTWSASFNVSAIGDGGNVIDISASQTDGFGNVGNATLVEANKDSVLPSVATTGAPMATLSNQSAYPVSGTCTAGDGDVTVSIVGATPASQSTTCSGGGTWSTSIDVSAIGDGSNVIDINASQTDSAGNTGDATLVEASKDATAPVVATTGAPTATAANQASYPVNGTCSLGDGDVTVSIVGATPASQSAACGGGGSWSTSFDVSAIGDGSNVIDISASQTDSAGNTGSATLVEANKDATAPVVATTGAPTATLANEAAYPVSGTCTAGDGNVAVSIVGATPGSQAVACSGGGTWSATFAVNAIGDGADVIDISASQTDSSGNTGNAVLVEASKDTTLPVVVITSAPTVTLANQSSYPVSGSCTSGDGDVTVSVVGATPASQAASCAGGSWSTSFDVSGIGDGANVIDVDAVQTDTVGNTGIAAQVEADKDASAPALAIQNAPGSVSDLAPYSVAFEFTEDVTGFTLGDVTVGNGAASNFAVVDGNTYTADITPNGNGSITLDVAANLAQDGVGNQNTAAAQVTTLLSTDDDNDGIPDSVECPSGPPFNTTICGTDSDGDSIPDFQETDADGDGIPDSVEAGGDPAHPVDSDGDGSADYQDTDADDDGLPDSVEAGSDPGNPVDTDNDGTADYLDLDADDDGIPDSVETGSDPNNPVDTDSDGTADFRDTDSDGDAIPDAVEAGTSGTDTDSDGIDDSFDVDQTSGSDANGDGIDDDAALDTDSDGFPDFQDVDADGDGIPDRVEAGVDPANPVDSDSDGSSDYQDLDADDDGVADAVESGVSGIDTDGDGIDDSFDVDQTGGTDLDGDGIDDDVSAADANGDGTPDYLDSTDSDADGLVDSLDLDDDNDGILDAAEGSESVDSDGDGVADSLDLDSDNDGLFDLNESGANVTGLDADADGRIDGGQSLGVNGMADLLESSADSGSANYGLLDSDGDGVDNFRDLDSDGDGIYDLAEAGGGDADNDGRIDGLNDLDADGLHDLLSGMGLPRPDSDGDGVIDSLDLDSDNDGLYDVSETDGSDADGDGRLGGSPQIVDANGVATGSGLIRVDSDSDGVADLFDLDSDNDGIPDVTEAGGSDPDGDGRVGSGAPAVDAGGVTSAPMLPDDEDNDGTANHRDLDADGDGQLDIVEGGGFDTNADGRIDGLSDANGDGLDDLVAITPLPLPDDDGDGIADYLDNDDQDSDGVPDTVDIDLDNDGIPNGLEGDGAVDTDNDGVPDSRDLDSDNDGRYDLVESGADGTVLDGDGNGTVDGIWDVGSNGMADTVETAVDSGSIAYNAGTLLDRDSDGVHDFRDLDSDNDGLYDVTESGGSDPDGDGVLGNGTPAVNGNGLAPGSGAIALDTDGDGVPDPLDLDSDNDGVADVLEAGGSDEDGDGRPGTGAPSVDPNTGVPLMGSGLLALDTDNDGLPDYRDLDSDNDGVYDLAEAGIGGNDSAPNDGMLDAPSDSNGNGLDDSLEGVAVRLPDSDNDGIPDLRDNVDDSAGAPVKTGGGGCTLGSGGATDPLLLLLVLMAWVYLARGVKPNRTDRMN